MGGEANAGAAEAAALLQYHRLPACVAKFRSTLLKYYFPVKISQGGGAAWAEGQTLAQLKLLLYFSIQ
ncbi:hypothetical protein J3R74_000032 [Puniceicoccus vermicola]